MTYCLSLRCNEGLVFCSDSRTSAGVDSISTHPKMRVYERKGDRVLCLLSSGNLSITQSVTALIERDLERSQTDPSVSHFLNQHNLYETARYVGERIREVARMDAEAFQRTGIRFNINLILGGQIGQEEHHMFQIYPEGNAIHASRETPFLQIGDLKYGKPILDRGFRHETPLAEAVKYGLLSLDATAKSNVSVGPPFEIFCYRAGELAANHRLKFFDNDPYLKLVQERWQRGLIDLVRDIPLHDSFPQ